MVRTPWTELLEISHAGRLAGRALAVAIAASALVLVAASWDDLWRPCPGIEGRCVERAAGAGILLMASVGAALGAAVIWTRVGRRSIDPEGSSRYVWALGGLFAIGMVLIAARIPAYTCERGRFDDALTLCMHPPSTSEPVSSLLPKRVIVGVGLLGGVAIAATPRLTSVWIVVAGAAWALGFGWSVADALTRPELAAFAGLQHRSPERPRLS